MLFSEFRLVLITSVIFSFICMATAGCLSSDFSFLVRQSGSSRSNNIIERSLLGQSLLDEHSNIEHFHHSSVKGTLLSQHQELYQMLAIITQYLDSFSRSEPHSLIVSWQELLTHSIADAGVRRGPQNELTKAINEVVAAVATATEAVAKAVRACMALLGQLSQYVGLDETRTMQLLHCQKRMPDYQISHNEAGSMRDFINDVEQIVAQQVGAPVKKKRSWLASAGVLIAILTLGALSILAATHVWKQKKTEDDTRNISAADDGGEAVQRAGSSSSPKSASLSALDTAERAHWRRRALETVTPASSPAQCRPSSAPAPLRAHPAVPQ